MGRRIAIGNWELSENPDHKEFISRARKFDVDIDFCQVLDYQYFEKDHFDQKRLLEMSSVAENNRIIPAIDKLYN